MTGRDPWGINMFCNEGRQPFPADTPKLAEVLTASGYQTHAAGKMHCYPTRDRLGFCEVENDEEYRLDENGRPHDYERYLRDQGLAHRMTSHGIGPNQYGWRIDSIPEQHSPTHWVADRACHFLERRDTQRPFFLYASFRQPHPPFVVQPEYWEMVRDADVPMPVYGDWCERKQPDHWQRLHRKHRTHLWWDHPNEIPNNIRAYAAMISHIDSMVGMILGALAEHGVKKNTWVLLVADHGEMLFDHKGFAKATPFSGSSLVPFFVKPPVHEIMGTDREPALPRIDTTQQVGLQDVMQT
jgi:arylsulfatase A-like enzyme